MRRLLAFVAGIACAVGVARADDLADADADGFVQLPNINMVEEMVNMITASRTYEAGVTALQSMKSIASRALTIGK